MRLAGLAAAAALVLAPLAAISAPAIINGGAGGGSAIAETNDSVGYGTFQTAPSTVVIPANGLVVVFAANASANAATCWDSVNGSGVTYTAIAAFSGNYNTNLTATYFIAPSSLAVGTTWYCYFGDSNYHDIQVDAFTGINTTSPLNAGSSGANGSSGSTASIGPVSANSGQLVIYGLALLRQNEFTTEDSGFTTIGATAGGSIEGLHAAYRIVTQTGSVTATPAMASGNNYAWAMGSFAPSAVAAAATKAFLLTGVGP